MTACIARLTGGERKKPKIKKKLYIVGMDGWMDGRNTSLHVCTYYIQAPLSLSLSRLEEENDIPRIPTRGF
jgi:hypothetical protein